MPGSLLAGPGKTGVLGGGAESATLSTGVNINSTLPDQLSGGKTAWQAAMTSSDSSTSRFTVYAVCRSSETCTTRSFTRHRSNGPVRPNRRTSPSAVG